MSTKREEKKYEETTEKVGDVTTIQRKTVIEETIWRVPVGAEQEMWPLFESKDEKQVDDKSSEQETNAETKQEEA